MPPSSHPKKRGKLVPTLALPIFSTMISSTNYANGMVSIETKRIMPRGVRGKEDSLYLKWSTVMNPSELLKELIGNRDHARALFHGLRRQVNSIRHRSQSYDDGQVTIYDRVLLRLYDEGHTMQHYGLLEFYLAEYLETKNCHSGEESNSVIAAHFAAQRILDNGLSLALMKFTFIYFNTTYQALFQKSQLLQPMTWEVPSKRSRLANRHRILTHPSHTTSTSSSRYTRKPRPTTTSFRLLRTTVSEPTVSDFSVTRPRTSCDT